ncbi:MAG: peptidoglycan-binding protein [Elainellaceae cyanobacterium]
MNEEYKKSVEALEPVEMVLGNAGSAVSNLQSALRAAGYYKGAIDGSYNVETAQAVAQLQGYFGITATGIYDTETWYALSFWLSEEQGWDVCGAMVPFNLLDALRQFCLRFSRLAQMS